MKLYFEVFKKFSDFFGKAKRDEFCAFAMISTAVIVAFEIAIFSVENLFALKVLNTLLGVYVVATVLPSIALIMRRLHCIGRSRRMVILLLIPIVGAIYLVWLCLQEDKLEGCKSHHPTA
ncbi:DUF805 domain-containing protein [Maridesulfovibrio frigidus]|uniref:DUF805 domain-containing protein n=1 Tax=Maridesulfovibrio frigidus TaxID=340956 RepID=UPI00068B2BB7|nr:DUF805 domain-containing protein [Maridesulfovibrio frigidus]